MATIRPAAVAGSFYPADPHELRSSVERLLTAQPVTKIDVVPKMVIVPHAGHVYSGAVAASAYRMLAADPDMHRRVVLIGPSHFVRFAGMATPGVDALVTPLGPVPVDSELTAAVEAFASVTPLPTAHAREHSLEVQLPFLQVALDDLEVLALLTGDIDPQNVAIVLDDLVAVPGVICIVSSDLSHYLDHDTARHKDAATAAAIVELRAEDIGGDDACGRTAVKAALLVARSRRWGCRLLDLATSGDTAGSRGRVVGYGAFVLGPQA